MRQFIASFFTFALFLCCIIALGASPAYAEQGVTPDKILVGVSNAQNGPAAFLGQELLKGAEAYFSHINNRGGVYGRHIQVVAYNDGYEPKKCITNTKRLLSKDKVFLLFGYVGTPTVQAVLPMLAKTRVPFFFPFSGAGVLRDMRQSPTVFNLRASYEQETLAMASHLARKGKKKLAVFFQDDSYGRNGLYGVEKALKKFPSLRLVAKSCYKRNTTAINNSLITILKSRPDAVILVGAYKPCAAFINRAHQLGLRHVVFVNISFVGSKALAENLADYGDNEILATQVVPLPWDTSVPAVEEYQQVMQTLDPLFQPGFVSLEGFLDAKLLVHLLRITGPQPTREKLLHTAHNAYGIDIGLGEKISFTPVDNQGLKCVSLTQITKDTFKKL